MRKPNLFVVGAPKCATTSLHAYLAQHPECLMSAVKEPAYFSRERVRPDIRSSVPYIQSEAAYLALFSGATAAHRIVGESSTCYMRAAEDLAELKAFAGSPKIVAMVRDPVSLVSSYFHYLRFQGWEPLESLRGAWEVQDARCAGVIESATANRPDSLAYRNVAMLGRQVQRLFEMFGRDDVLVLVLDDLRDDAEPVCRRLQEFLGLTYVADLPMPRVNVARAAKVQLVDSLLKRTPMPLQRFKNRVKGLVGMRSLGIRALIERFNTETISHSVDPRLRDEVRDCFRSDVELLGRLLERDLLSLWGWSGQAAAPASARDASQCG